MSSFITRGIINSLTGICRFGFAFCWVLLFSTTQRNLVTHRSFCTNPIEHVARGWRIGPAPPAVRTCRVSLRAAAVAAAAAACCLSANAKTKVKGRTNTQQEEEPAHPKCSGNQGGRDGCESECVFLGGIWFRFFFSKSINISILFYYCLFLLTEFSFFCTV